MAVKPKSQALEMPTCEDRLLWDVLSSRMHIPALVVAEQVGLFSLLAKGPATGEAIARQLALRPRKSEALLALLAALGFLSRPRAAASRRPQLGCGRPYAKCRPRQSEAKRPKSL